MKRNKKNFIISFVGLKEGEHEFRFNIDEVFFEDFENTEINTCDIELLVELTKRNNMLVLDFELNGSLTLPCDRCLDDLKITVEGNQKLFIKFGKEKDEESEEVIIIPQSAHDVDIKQHIYEYISLLIPQKNIHPSGGCNKDVERKLNELAVAEEEATDPRWNALKNYNIN